MGYVGAKLEGWFGKGSAQSAAADMADAAGDFMVGRVREHTPVETGHLRTSIHKTPLRLRPSLGGVTWETGAETGVDYAPYVEHGTGLWGPRHAPYEIRPRRPGGALSWRDPFTGKRIFARRVIHPGSPGAHMFTIGVALTEAGFPAIARPTLLRWAREQGQNRTFTTYGKAW